MFFPEFTISIGVLPVLQADIQAEVAGFHFFQENSAVLANTTIVGSDHPVVSPKMAIVTPDWSKPQVNTTSFSDFVLPDYPKPQK